MAQRDARPPFAAIDGAVPLEFSALPTPCYGCAAQPDAAVLAVLDRHRRQHGRGLAVFFQHQNIFQPGDVLQPARRIDGVCFGSPAAQRRQRGQIISGSLTQHGHHLFFVK